MQWWSGVPGFEPCEKERNYSASCFVVLNLIMPPHLANRLQETPAPATVLLHWQLNPEHNLFWYISFLTALFLEIFMY